MTTIKLKDYDVQFPYEKAYDLQVDYMEKVITCLDEVSSKLVFYLYSLENRKFRSFLGSTWCSRISNRDRKDPFFVCTCNNVDDRVTKEEIRS